MQGLVAPVFMLHTENFDQEARLAPQHAHAPAQVQVKRMSMLSMH